jgi:GDPmannose 4,6-dehydratase
MQKRALICGVSGQDGSYLARLLLDKNYTVFGSSRDAQLNSFANLTRLGIKQQVQLVSMSLTDFRSVLQALTRIEPDEVYNISGQSSVALSFDQPVETMDSIARATLNLLEALRFTKRATRLYNACTSECFGDIGTTPANESFPFHRRSPYAAAKATGFWEVANYRETYGLHSCSGILFNHESPLRPPRFVTRKIVSAACRIARGSPETLILGNVKIRRDWGWAPEYVDAMWRMLQLDTPEDLVIATGESRCLEEFVAEAFDFFGLDWHEFVVQDQALYRPSDLLGVSGNPEKARRMSGWSAERRMKAVVQEMARAERAAMTVFPKEPSDADVGSDLGANTASETGATQEPA